MIVVSDDRDIDEVVHRQSELFDVLGNGCRLEILYHLDDERDNVSSIADALNRDQGNVSHHLRILRYGDVLASKTEGRERYYWIKRPEILELCEDFLDLLKRDDDL